MYVNHMTTRLYTLEENTPLKDFNIDKIEWLVIRDYKPKDVNDLFYKLVADFGSPKVKKILNVGFNSYYDFYRYINREAKPLKNIVNKKLITLLGVLRDETK